MVSTSGAPVWQLIAGRRIKNLNVVSAVLLVCSIAVATTVSVSYAVNKRIERTLAVKIATARLEERMSVLEGGQLQAVASVSTDSANKGEYRWLVRLRDPQAGRVGVADFTLDEAKGVAVCNVVLPSGAKRDGIQVSAR